MSATIAVIGRCALSRRRSSPYGDPPPRSGTPSKKSSLSRDRQYEAPMDRLCSRAHRVVRRARLGGRAHLPAGAAGARARRHERRRAALRPRRDAARARTSGSRSAAWRSARSGATAATSRPTGRPTGCTARLSSSSTRWAQARRTAARTTQLAARSSRRRCASGCSELIRTQHLRPGDAARSRSTPVRARGVRGERRALRRRLRATAATSTRCPPGTLTDADAAARSSRRSSSGRPGPRRPNRPGDDVTYTSNWPHEPLVGNRPTGDAVVWTGVSIIVLLAGIGAHGVLVRRAPRARTPHGDAARATIRCSAARADAVAARDASSTSGSSAALLLVQILLGVVTAHYGVEGDGFYGIPLAECLPYVVARTWHMQLGIFWIATAWLAAGLYIAPGGRRRRADAASGSASTCCSARCWSSSSARWPGEWLSVKQHARRRRAGSGSATAATSTSTSGRVWQIALLVGLFLWLVLMARALLAGAASAGRAAARCWRCS